MLFVIFYSWMKWMNYLTSELFQCFCRHGVYLWKVKGRMLASLSGAIRWHLSNLLWLHVRLPYIGPEAIVLWDLRERKTTHLLFIARLNVLLRTFAVILRRKNPKRNTKRVRITEYYRKINQIYSYICVFSARLSCWLRSWGSSTCVQRSRSVNTKSWSIFRCQTVELPW